MNCAVCNNEHAYATRSVFREGAMVELGCDRCGGVSASLPDAYLGHIGQKFANLCDKMGKPYEIQSKRHKKEVMDQLGVREAAGTVNGQRFGSETWIDGTRAYRKRQFEKERPGIREIFKRWKETGYAK